MKLEMKYGLIKKLLSSEYKEFDDTVLIENRFKETTRHGGYIRYVQLGLTPKTFIIASEQYIHLSEMKSNQLNGNNNIFWDIVSLYPWESLKLTIFKRSKRKSIKATFINNSTRYFELGNMNKRKIFWNLWCSLVMELNSANKMWPFTCGALPTNEQSFKGDRPHVRTSEKKCHRKWTDKYLYLGSKREIQDKVRPVPMSGLGPAEELKLLHLKPRYFGCWEQSEHWVQCGDCSSEFLDLNKSAK